MGVVEQIESPEDEIEEGVDAGPVEGLLVLEGKALLVENLDEVEGLLILLGVKEILGFGDDPFVVFRVEEAEQIDVGHC